MAYFITVEGIDGAGKSTHLEFIQNHLNKKNIQNKLTREPGGTEIGEKLRQLLLHDDMDVGTETMMLFAARHEHLVTVIQPALKSNISIVCDRFTDASYAYQQEGRVLISLLLNHYKNWCIQTLPLTLLFCLILIQIPLIPESPMSVT